MRSRSSCRAALSPPAHGACSAVDGSRRSSAQRGGLSGDDIERRHGEVAARGYLSDDRDCRADLLRGQGPTRCGIDQALARVVTFDEPGAGWVGNQFGPSERVEELAESGITSSAPRSARMSSSAPSRASTPPSTTASSTCVLTKLAPSAQRDPDPVSRPFRPATREARSATGSEAVSMRCSSAWFVALSVSVAREGPQDRLTDLTSGRHRHHHRERRTCEVRNDRVAI